MELLTLTVVPSSRTVRAQAFDRDGTNETDILTTNVSQDMVNQLSALFKGAFTAKEVDQANVRVNYVEKWSDVSVFYTRNKEKLKYHVRHTH